jgi:4-hydroxy-3-methylbut-2-enyl diphosphate reductase
MAYEARAHYPDKSIHITNEIIHNPQVNQRLREMDVHFLEKAGGAVDVAGVAEGDVVVLPAFGATIQEMQILDAK